MTVHNKALSQWLSNRFFYVKTQSGQKVYWDSVSGVRSLTFQHLIEHLIQQGLKHDGNPIPVGKSIVDHTYFRPVVLDEIYWPSADPVVCVEGNWHPNSWETPKVKPNVGIDPSPFIEHLTRMLGSQDKADYVMDMLAYRYQKPDFTVDAKPHVAFFFYGAVGGMGKSLFAETLTHVFGESAVRRVIDQTALTSMSAVDIWTRTWTIVEEVDVKKGSTDYNSLKTMIGGSSFHAARKGEHFRRHETPAQLVMLSNHAPNFIEPNDRRFFISKWMTHFESQQAKDEYFREYIAWLNRDGYQAIAGLLEQRDISQVSVESAAMMTDEKMAVTSLMSDPVVEEIKLTLEAEPDRVCFTAVSFFVLFEEHKISKLAQRYKLSEADLHQTPKKRYHNRVKEFWLRPGWRLEAVNGKKPRLLNDNLQLEKLLEDDEGYQAEFTLVQH
jgi:hypothetical protein